MKHYLLALAAFAVMTPVILHAQSDSPSSGRVYELRTYSAAPGKLPALNARFREHTARLFERHGIENVGYWMPIENAENKLIYILSYPNRESAERSWKAFMSDPEWQAAWKASEAGGKLVEKVESVYMRATDYSPEIKVAKSGRDRVFELRIYTTPPGKLPELHARFRDHTMKLFSKHGMTHIGYWTPTDASKGADNTLIYLLAHDSVESARESFSKFRQDPDWIEAKAASEVNGSLTVKDGVKSIFVKATDYSPLN